jgi:hypothetical protein
MLSLSTHSSQAYTHNDDNIGHKEEVKKKTLCEQNSKVGTSLIPNTATGQNPEPDNMQVPPLFTAFLRNMINVDLILRLFQGDCLASTGYVREYSTF